MSLIAFVTTTDNTIGADAGITISRYVAAEASGAGDVHDDLATETAEIGTGEDGWLDEDAAAAVLSRMGYAAAGQWNRSGGQWAAEVQSI